MVFYIVHNGGPENISDLQVSSQLDVMNAEFAGHGVEFCLASTDGSTPLPGTPNPGIIRIQSPLTDHLQAQEQQLKALSPLDGTRFLRVWVVKDINNGSGIAGYARFPGATPPWTALWPSTPPLGNPARAAAPCCRTMTRAMS
ncbi:MAG: hypothetical protein AAGB22_03430 [Bacteroidota bacterium]